MPEAYGEGYYLARSVWEGRLDSGAMDAIAMLEVASGRYFLDVGSGLGRLSAEIARRGGSVLGIDVSAYAVSEAMRRYAYLPRIEFSRVDASQIADRNRYDGIICYHVLEHFECNKTDTLLSKFSDALKPSGILVLSLPVNDRSIAKRIGYACLRLFNSSLAIRVIDPTHLCFFTIDGISAKLTRLGFEIVGMFLYSYIGVPLSRMQAFPSLTRLVASAVTLKCLKR